MTAAGKLIGLGTGPGDPDLLTVKALKALETADVIAFFAKAGRSGNGRSIVAHLIKDEVILLPLYYPITTEITASNIAYKEQITAFYEASALSVAAHLDAGQTVAVLSEGDPLFYGSYMHLHVRLAHRYLTEIIPGITAMSGCWSAAKLPIAQGDDVLSVLPGRLAENELNRRLADTQAAVIIKVGWHLPKIRRALKEVGRLRQAIYVERGTMTNAAIMPLCKRGDEEVPYFSLVLVPGWKTRP